MLILHVGALFPAKLFLILTNSKDYNGSNFDFNINIHSHTNAYLQVITFQYIYEIEFKREEICIKRFQMQEGLYFLFPFLIMTTYQTFSPPKQLIFQKITALKLFTDSYPMPLIEANFIYTMSLLLGTLGYVYTIIYMIRPSGNKNLYTNFIYAFESGLWHQRYTIYIQYGLCPLLTK